MASNINFDLSNLFRPFQVLWKNIIKIKIADFMIATHLLLQFLCCQYDDILNTRTCNVTHMIRSLVALNHIFTSKNLFLTLNVICSDTRGKVG